MSTLHGKIVLKDCGSTHCNLDAGCQGHVITAEFQNTADVGSVYIDGKYAFGGGDRLMGAVADIVNDLWVDEPRYLMAEKEEK